MSGRALAVAAAYRELSVAARTGGLVRLPGRAVRSHAPTRQWISLPRVVTGEVVTGDVRCPDLLMISRREECHEESSDHVTMTLGDVLITSPVPISGWRFPVWSPPAVGLGECICVKSEQRRCRPGGGCRSLGMRRNRAAVRTERAWNPPRCDSDTLIDH